MNALKKCLTAAAILSLCTFGACKKKDEQHPAQQQQATEAAHALLQVSREIAEQTATVAIEEYIPADAVVAVVSSPDINISEIPVVAMFKDEDLKPEGVTQIGFFMKPDYTVAIVSFESADKAQNIISKNAAKPESQTRTAGSSNRPWTVCGPFKSDDKTPGLYRAYHAEGNSLFIAIGTTIDDKAIDAFLDKPTAKHPISQIRQQKTTAVLSQIDNLALLQNPGMLAPIKISQEFFSSFIKEQNITAEFIKNFPTTKLVMRSDDKATNFEILLTFADPNVTAKLSSLRIPAPELSKKPTVAAATLNIDMLKAYDWLTEIAGSVQLSILPNVLQQPFQALSTPDDADTLKLYRELIARFGAISFKVYKFAQSSEYTLDIEGRNLTETIDVDEDPSALDIKFTPITFVNSALMGFMMSVTHMLPDTFIEADKINAVTLKSPDNASEGDKFYAGANKDRIVIANSEADVKELLDNKPQFSERNDLFDLEISEQTILRTNPFFAKSPKPISKIAIGVGAADNGIKLHMDWLY